MASLLKTLTRLQGRKPGALLTIAQILEWADAHHAATGRWPSTSSGRIGQSRFGASWKAIDLALRKGLHDAPRVSLAIFLHERRGKKLRVDVEKARSPVEARPKKRPAHVGDREELSIERILGWADAHHAATGRWPTKTSGPIAGVPGESWRTVAAALCEGRRGLPGGTTLSRLLLQHRGRLGLNRPPNLTVRQILSWADAYYATHECWPNERRGKVAGAPGETWTGIDRRLRKGGRGLPGGSSLSHLLAKHRGTRNSSVLPDLSIVQIVTWVHAHHAATGKWPNNSSGAVRDARGESWKGINEALRGGRRGLPGGMSLARLLDQHRPKRSGDLTRQQILAWARAHRDATGEWPSAKSGTVAAAPGETWNNIDRALFYGYRGLPSGSSLSRLLRGPLTRRRPGLTLDQILVWGDAYHAATGRCPTSRTGAIRGAPGEDWRSIDNALRRGWRSLPGGSSLDRLLDEHRPHWGRDLTVEQIQTWGAAHRAATGRWPTRKSGAIAGARGKTWMNIDRTLRRGLRGVPSGLSLARLFGRTPAPPRPRLTVEQVLAWGEAHHAATGQWPCDESGAIRGAPGENWKTIGSALRRGYRGLPSGTTLREFFALRHVPSDTGHRNAARSRPA